MEIHNAYESLDNIELFKVTSFGTPFNGIHFNKSTAKVIFNDCKIDERCCVNGQHVDVNGGAYKYLTIGSEISRATVSNTKIGRALVGTKAKTAIFNNCFFKNY